MRATCRRCGSTAVKKRCAAAVPWYSNGNGGIRTHTSSVISATSASTSPSVKAATKRSSRARSCEPPGAGGHQRFIAGYAQDEADRADLGITVTAVLPRITPLTDVGRPAVQAYAARNGQPEDEYIRQLGTPLTPDVAGKALVELLKADAATLAPRYLLTGSGLQQLA